MSARFAIIILVVLAIGLLIFNPFRGIERESGPVTLTILHTQEHHGQLLPLRASDGVDYGGVSARATLIDEIRKSAGDENVLLVDSGDLLIGTALSAVFRGEPDILSYNAMGYDATALGNHEFDFESKENRLEQLMALSNFPMMGANLSGLTFSADPGFVKVRLAGLDLLLIGIANPHTPEASSPNPATRFADPKETISALLNAHAKLIDLAVIVTHQETLEDVALLQSITTTRADVAVVIIGGHTAGFRGLVACDTFSSSQEIPDLIADQPTELAQDIFQDCNGIYVRAGEGPLNGRLGTSLGRLEITINNKKLVSATSQNIPVIPETENNREKNVAGMAALHPEIEALVQPFVEELGARLQEIIGLAEVDLDGERQNVRTRETNLGNFLSDILRLTQKTEIGLMNGGGIRASIPAGEITLEEILTVLPFGNTITTLQVTGAQLKEAMENSVSMIESSAGRFLQISGMTLSYDPERPAGRRVMEIRVNGEPLDMTRLYSIATNNFIAGGGDGYDLFKTASNLFDTQFVLADVVADFIREAGVISAQMEGRIKRSE